MVWPFFPLFVVHDIRYNVPYRAFTPGHARTHLQYFETMNRFLIMYFSWSIAFSFLFIDRQIMIITINDNPGVHVWYDLVEPEGSDNLLLWRWWIFIFSNHWAVTVFRFWLYFIFWQQLNSVSLKKWWKFMTVPFLDEE